MLYSLQLFISLDILYNKFANVTQMLILNVMVCVDATWIPVGLNFEYFHSVDDYLFCSVFGRHGYRKLH